MCTGLDTSFSSPGRVVMLKLLPPARSLPTPHPLRALLTSPLPEICGLS
jgi:hypothetical protein